MRKRILSLLLVLAMTIGLLIPLGVVSVSAETVKSITEFNESDAAGTVYTIGSSSDLLAFNTNVSGSSGKGSGYIFRLTADIDLNPGWVAKPEVSSTSPRVNFPAAADYSWVCFNFAGTFDGQGHTISGLYRDAEIGNWGDSGLFFKHLTDNATVRNLSIVNSFFYAHQPNNNTGNQIVGGLASYVNGNNVVLENLYVDIDVWDSGTGTQQGLGGVVGRINDGKTGLVIRNVAYAGTVGTVSTKGATAYPSSGGGSTAQLIGNANSRSATLSNIVLAGSVFAKSGTYNNIVQTGGGNVTKINIVAGKYASVDAANSASAITGYNSGTISMTYNSQVGTIIPTSVVNVLRTPQVKSINDYDLEDFWGTTYTISSADDLLTFKTKMNDAGVAGSKPGAGRVFVLTDDIDLNPGWVGKVLVDEETKYVSVPSAPATQWSNNIANFYGILDGQGHTISGMYAYRSVGSWGAGGGFIGFTRGNSVIRNLIFTNSLVYGQATGTQARLGGLVSYANGANTTIENVYADIDVWMFSNYLVVVGGVMAQVNDNCDLKIKNVVYAGTTGIVSSDRWEYSSITGSMCSQLLANANNRPVQMSNIVLAGNAYANASAVDQIVKGNAGSVTKTNVVVGKYATVDAANSASAITGYNSGSISMTYNATAGTIVPTSVNALGLSGVAGSSYTVKSISAYTGTEAEYTTFTISNAEELLYAAQLSQNGVTFNKMILALTADIDLNPGWDADVTITDGTGTLPTVPATIFPGFATLRGKLDGNGYTISGIYMVKYIRESSSNLAFIEYLAANGSVKNLKIKNSFIFADMQNDSYTTSDCKIGGVVARITGDRCRIDGVYADINVWARTNKDQRIAGFVAKTDANHITINNVIFAGTVGTILPLNNAVPGTEYEKMYMSQIVSDANWKTTLLISNFAMNGTCYAKDGVTTTKAIASNQSGSATVTAGTPTVTASSAGSPAAFALWPASGTADTNCASWTDGQKQIRYYQAMTAEQFVSWTDSLEAAGYEQVQGYALDSSRNNSFLYTNGIYNVYGSWLSAVGTARARVIVEPYGANYNTSKTFESSTRVCDSQIWQLDVDNYYSGQHGGMGYIIRLTNGEFIVIDGGYLSAEEAANVYSILSSNNVLGGKPVIAAWFITHLHSDHFGGFVRFARLYNTKVTVKGFYCAFPKIAVGNIAANTDIYTVLDHMARFDGAQVYEIHSGMTVGFADATATILSTYEDVKQSYWNGSITANNFYDANDTSLVVRFDVKNKTGSSTTKFMVLGDACSGVDKVLRYTWTATELGANIVQVAHHGMNANAADVNTALYSTIGASVYLWPAEVLTYDPSTKDPRDPRGLDADNSFYNLFTSHSRDCNGWIKSNATEVIPAWQNVCLTLPYTAGSYLTSTGIKSGNSINCSTAYTRKLKMDSSATFKGLYVQTGNADADSVDLRFLGSVSDVAASNLASFGFIITLEYNGTVKTITREVDSVYTAVNAAGATVNAADCNGGDYLYAYVLRDVPNDITVKINVTAFGTLTTGEKISSTTSGYTTLINGAIS